MSNNTPSFDYEGAIKEPVRRSARWHFERKPYSIKGSDANATSEEERKRSEKGVSWCIHKTTKKRESA